MSPNPHHTLLREQHPGGARQILGRDPAAILALVQAALTLLLSFGALSWAGLTTQTDLMVTLGVLNALSAVYLAWGTTETALAAVIELFKAGLSFAAIYGLSISVEQTALAIVLINAVATAFLRTQTSPLTNGSFETISPDDTVTPPVADAGEIGRAVVDALNAGAAAPRRRDTEA